MTCYNVVCSQDPGTLVEWLFTFSFICISLSLIFTARCLIKIISFFHQHGFGLFGTHDDDWKNFNTVQINLEDGHQTKQSKATPWANRTQHPNARVHVPCGGRAQHNGMNEQMESDRFFYINHYVALFWLWNRVWFHLS